MSECKYKANDGECLYEKRFPYKEYCVEGPCPHDMPQTNYDLLISKTPEELAKTIVGWLADAAELCGENRQEFDFTKAEEYAVSWLKAPAEDVPHEE